VSDESEIDSYLDVTRGFPSGLLVTFNESTDHETPVGELTVVRSHDDGTLDLKQSTPGAFEDTHYCFGPADQGGVELVELDDEGHGTDWTTVETIEVVGFE